MSASQAEHGGSIPLTCSKIKAPAEAGAFILGAAGSFSCSAEVNSACAKVLAAGQNTCTAQKRRPTVWGPDVLRRRTAPWRHNRAPAGSGGGPTGQKALPGSASYSVAADAQTESESTTASKRAAIQAGRNRVFMLLIPPESFEIFGGSISLHSVDAARMRNATRILINPHILWLLPYPAQFLCQVCCYKC